MTAASIIALCREQGIELKADGDRLRFRPNDIPAALRQALTANKLAILAALAPKPTGCAWREDERGRLIFSDGMIYAPTDAGGWLLVQHPTKRMRTPGTLEISP